MGKGLLAESQGGMPLTEIVAGNDGTIGSNFSLQVSYSCRSGGGDAPVSAVSFTGAGNLPRKAVSASCSQWSIIV